MKLSDTDYSLLRELQQNEKHKRNYVKRFAATRSWRFRRRKLSATTELDMKHKASFNH